MVGGFIFERLLKLKLTVAVRGTVPICTGMGALRLITVGGGLIALLGALVVSGGF